MNSAALLTLTLACIVAGAALRTRRAVAALSLAVCALFALGVPLGEVAYKCLPGAVSQGCVWTRALLPVSQAVGAVAAGLCWLAALALQRRRRSASGATNSSHALDDAPE